MSSVRMAILKPSPGAPRRRAAGMRQASNRMRARGWGAITSIRSTTEKPGSSAKTTKAERPRAPGASPVRATTV